ncbi:hypothetical protein C8J57DRAFT_1212615 [Mycena rebaudengoi]|nr:hypothetical protein C8J57DRAFT_1212615 [Mycena rebaudengoi]
MHHDFFFPPAISVGCQTRRARHIAQSSAVVALTRMLPTPATHRQEVRASRALTPVMNRVVVVACYAEVRGYTSMHVAWIPELLADVRGIILKHKSPFANGADSNGPRRRRLLNSGGFGNGARIVEVLRRCVWAPRRGIEWMIAFAGTLRVNEE